MTDSSVDELQNAMDEVSISDATRKIRNAKQKIRDALSIIPEGYKNELINSLTEEDMEFFTRQLNNIQGQLDTLGFSKKGSVSCGENYTNYEAIRDMATGLYNTIEKDTNYQRILQFCLKPLAVIPEAKVFKDLEKGRGERTFSKEILNRAIKICSDRTNFVQGEWSIVQNKWDKASTEKS